MANQPQKPKKSKPFAQFFPSAFGHGKKKRDEADDTAPLEPTDPKARIEKLEKIVQDMVNQVARLKEWRGNAKNTPIHQVSFDEFFKVDVNDGNLTVEADKGELQRQLVATGGGGGVANSSIEETFVNSIGCIDDPDDDNCGIPFDVTFRVTYAMVDGVLTRALENAFAQFHNDCKFFKCGVCPPSPCPPYTPNPPVSYTSDRWRACGLSSSGPNPSGDIILPKEVFNLGGSMGSLIIKINEIGSCYRMIARLVNEAPSIVDVYYCPNCLSCTCQGSVTRTGSPCCVSPPSGGDTCNCTTCYHIEDSSTGDFIDLGVSDHSTCVYDDVIDATGILLGDGSVGLYLGDDGFWHIVYLQTAAVGWTASYVKSEAGGCPDGTYNLDATDEGTPPATLTVTAACVAPSCTCADNTEPATVTVTDYQSLDATSCSGCGQIAANPGNGILTHSGAGTCQWLGAGGGGGDPTKTFGTGNWREGALSINLIDPGGGADCFWRLIITCAFSGSLVWQGAKTFGNSPVGVYTRESGCDTRATMTVI